MIHRRQLAHSRRQGRTRSGTPVALRHDRWPGLSREIRRSVRWSRPTGLAGYANRMAHYAPEGRWWIEDRSPNAAAGAAGGTVQLACLPAGRRFRRWGHAAGDHRVTARRVRRPSRCCPGPRLGCGRRSLVSRPCACSPSSAGRTPTAAPDSSAKDGAPDPRRPSAHRPDDPPETAASRQRGRMDRSGGHPILTSVLE